MLAEHDITTGFKCLNPYKEVNYYGLSVSPFMAGLHVLVEAVFFRSWVAVLYIGIISNINEDTVNFSIDVSDMTIAELKEMCLKDFSDSFCPFYCTVCPSCCIVSIKGFSFSLVSFFE